MRPSGRRGGPESEAGAVPPRPGLLVGDWIVLLACHLGVWAGPRVARRSQCCLLRRAFLLGSRSMRDPGFMNLTTIEYLGFYSPIAGDQRILRANSCVWKPSDGLRDDSFHATTVVFIYNPYERFL